jgi:hypothetical protein
VSLYWINPLIKICEIYIIYFWRGIGLFIVCLAVDENAGMPENYRFIWTMNNKKKEGNLLAEIFSL